MSWMGLPFPRAARGNSEMSWMGLPFPRAARGNSEMNWMGLPLPRVNLLGFEAPAKSASKPDLQPSIRAHLGKISPGGP